MGSKKNNRTKNTSTPWIYPALAAGLILSLPLILIKIQWIAKSLTNTGQIGDTIGGITSPVIGLLSAFLIYKAFIAQVESNKIQIRDTEFGTALKLIDDLEVKLTNPNNKYDQLSLAPPKIEILNANLYEIIRFWPRMVTYRRSYMNKILIVIRQVKFLVKYIKNSNALSENDKSQLLEKASLAISGDLLYAFDKFLKTCGNTFDWPPEEQEFVATCRSFFSRSLDELFLYQVDLADVQKISDNKL